MAPKNLIRSLLCLLVSLIVVGYLHALKKQDEVGSGLRQSQVANHSHPWRSRRGAPKQRQDEQKSSIEPLEVRILTLFSGTVRDLGIDHRLGRQVLKLAASRARRLNPEVSKIELLVHSDESECRTLSRIPSMVAEQFYSEHSTNSSSTASCGANLAEQLECDPDSVGGFVGGRGGIDAILGPSCEHLIDLVARMAAYWRTPIYTTTSIGSVFARKHIYTTLTRLSPSINHLSMFVMRVMERFKWRHLAIVVDASQAENSALLANLEKTIERLRYTLPIYSKTFAFSSFSLANELGANMTGKFEQASEQAQHGDHPLSSKVGHPLKHCTGEAGDLFEGVRRSARVVLLLLNEPQVVRRLLLCAHELRLNNGDYTFLALNLGLKSAGSASSPTRAHQSQSKSSSFQFADSRNTENSFNWFQEQDEANNLKARQMFESLMIFSVELSLGDEYNLFVEQTLDMAHQEFPEARFERSAVGPIAVALHDSLLLAVEAKRRLYLRALEVARASGGSKWPKVNNQNGTAEGQANEAPTNQKAAPLLWGEQFSGGLMPSLRIDSRGDQELNYVLSDMEPELGLMRPVASYARDTRQVLMLPGAYIHWPARINAATRELLHNDEPPPDEPECGFLGQAERCIDRQNLHTALTVISLFLLVIAGVVAVSFRRYKRIKYQMQLEDYWWKISWSELRFLRRGAHQQMSLDSRCATSLAQQLKLSGASAVATSISNGPKRGEMVSEVVSAAAAAAHSTRRSAVPLIVTPNSLRASGGRGSPAQSVTLTHRRQASPAGSQVALSQLGDKLSLIEGATVLSSLFVRSELSAVVLNSSLALYRNELVIVKQLNANSIEVTRDLLMELKSIRDLSNENLARLVGLCLDRDHLAVVYEFCSRCDLQALLLNQSISIDWNLKFSIIGDIINGLNFIHTTLLDCHGRLKSTNLVLDSRFTVKLTDFGLKSLYSQLDLIENNDESDGEPEAGAERHPSLGSRHHLDQLNKLLSEHAEQTEDSSRQFVSDKQRRLSVTQTIYNMDSVSVRAEQQANVKAGAGSKPLGSSAHRTASERTNPNRMRIKNRGSARFFWTAPEHLRQRQPHLSASKRGDIYALAIVFFEILTRKEPYYFGTNAKPRWQAIKRDKMLHQRNQQARAPANNPLLSQHSAVGSPMGRSDSNQQGGGACSGRQTSVDRMSFSSKPGAHQQTGAEHPLSQISKVQARLKRRSQASVGPLPVEEVEMERRSSRSSSVKSQGIETVAAAKGEQSVKISISQFGGASPGERKSGAIGEEMEIEMEMEMEAEEEAASSLVSLAHTQPAAALAPGSSLHEAGKGRSAKAKQTAAGGEELDAEEILDQLRMGVQPEPVRPYIPNYLLQDVDPRLVALLRSCWHETPSLRPSASHVRNSLRKITKGATAKNYLDNLLNRLQTYASQLERIVDAKTADIMAEKMRTEELLYQLVPKFVADKLKRDEPIVAQVFDGITVFFSDIVGFEKYASIMSPSELVDLLNIIYSSFDSIISSFDVTKIEVILDQFLVAAGISLAQEQTGEPLSVKPNQKRQRAGLEKDVYETQKQKQQQQQQSSGAKPMRRLLGALRSESSEDRGGKQKRAKILARQSTEEATIAEATDEAADRATLATLPLDSAEHHKRSSAEQIARMALCIRDLVKSFNFRQNLADAPPSRLNEVCPTATEQGQLEREAVSATPRQPSARLAATSFNIRIGIHSGRVCAGIVGVKRPKFCLIGDTVNVASRMHTNSKANRIQVSTDTCELLRQVPGFNLEPRGRIEIKGKGLMETYWLESSY